MRWQARKATFMAMDPARERRTDSRGLGILARSLFRQKREQVWLLERGAELSLAAPGAAGDRAIVYTLRLRDEGLWRESWRSLLALEQSPYHRRGRSRGVIQLVAYAPHDGQLALDRTKQRLDRFIRDFREELTAL